MSNKKNDIHTLSERFRGYYPVVIDVETGGFNAKNDALLEIAAITLKMDQKGWLDIDKTLHFHLIPFEGANIEATSLAFTGIDPHNPLRRAVNEHTALNELFKMVKTGIKNNDCHRAIIVAHNANFDHSFIMAATHRTNLKHTPFHPFVTFDTATLSGLVFGQTILAKACDTAGIPFDGKQAHGALYDTDRTALLFCTIVNKWKKLGGWPLNADC
ncbi:ribonuclease T [Arsenophonus symbiont of Ornithomya chloropus]|uniref:ribonuclease T n=1 Tax=Arsenophonus symbiont of Ornithomya chloropus TaxID=634121 RepID=UPI0032B2981F